MRRRRLLAMLGACAVGPVISPPWLWAQQDPRPVVGFLRSTPAGPFPHLVEAFRQGLNEAGFFEDRNLTIEYRWADNDLDRLPALAADLIQRQADVIVGNSLAIQAARAAARNVPMVFVSADDPVKTGLVASLRRPGRNITGVTFFGGGRLGPKRIELLHELAPNTAAIAILVDPSYVGFEVERASVEAAARALGRRIVVVQAASEADYESAFATVALAGALFVAGSPAFTSRRHQLVSLAARHSVPAIYDQRDYVAAGGLISYAASFTEAYRQAGVYAGKILKGASPAELPVLQPTRFELVINLKTARTLGLQVPPSLLAQASEVIE